MCSSRRSRWPTSSLLLALFLGAPALASAQEESIFDADNPDAAQSSDTPDAPLQVGYFSGLYSATLGVDTLRDAPGEAIYELTNRLSLRARVPLTDQTSALVEARFDHRLLALLSDRGRAALPGRFDDVDTPLGALYSAQLGEAHVSTRFGPLLLRVGQQRVVWGSAEVTRPADVVNPLDLSAGPLGADLVAPTRPIFMAKADLVTEVASLQLLLIPFFEPHRASLVSGDFALARPSSPLAGTLPALALLDNLEPTLFESVESALVGTALPEQVPANASVGLRVSKLFQSAGNLSLALSYLFGWDRVPLLDLDPALAETLAIISTDRQFARDFDLLGLFQRNPDLLDLQQTLSDKAAAGQPLLSATYERWHVLALDGAFYLGPIGVRADLAFSPERTFLTEGFQSTRLPAFNTALELSYESDQGQLVAIAEGFWIHVVDAPEGRGAPLLFESDYFGLALGLQVDLERWFERLPVSVQLSALAGLRDLDLLMAPSLTWRLSEATRLKISAQIFTEPLKEVALSPGALYDTNDQLLFGVERNF